MFKTIIEKYSFPGILLTVLLLTNCSQQPDYTVSKNEKNAQYDDPTEETSLLSKKSYQEKLTRWLHPYKIDVQQGNLMTSDMLNQLKIGMTKQEVKHLLGTSLLTDSTSKNKWFYTFSNIENGELQKEQVVVLSFKANRLSDIKER